ncbi:hypothetical protein [Sinorhizobium meliloti]|uniref:hypothetical protein n=1 Tax=Rhizobium meliloti TaxID=382 RepID=UPI002D7A1317|nr:hypothetical protein [Sinorhizobium meliloti]
MGGANEAHSIQANIRWPEQWDALTSVIAALYRRYSIPVTAKTVLCHAEVQNNLGIQQPGKWDFTRLAFGPSVKGAKASGDKLRGEAIHALILPTLKEFTRRSLIFASVAALSLASCTTTGSIDAASQKNLLQVCSAAATAHSALVIVASTRNIKSRPITRGAAARSALDVVCKNPSSVTAATAIVKAAEAYGNHFRRRWWRSDWNGRSPFHAGGHALVWMPGALCAENRAAGAADLHRARTRSNDTTTGRSHLPGAGSLPGQLLTRAGDWAAERQPP